MAKMPEEYPNFVCKFGQGHETCAFLCMGPEGFECEKGTPLGYVLDERRRAHAMRARGDNCSGSPDFTLPDAPGGVE